MRSLAAAALLALALASPARAQAPIYRPVGRGRAADAVAWGVYLGGSALDVTETARARARGFGEWNRLLADSEGRPAMVRVVAYKAAFGGLALLFYRTGHPRLARSLLFVSGGAGLVGGARGYQLTHQGGPR